MRFLHGITIFWSAFLLFVLQPMIAKAILPWFGGTSTVWLICLLFFQVALFGGYLYAHGLIRLAAPAWQARIHASLLAAAALTLPVVPSARWKPEGGADPSWAILGLLAVSCGLPYFLLSATGPLVQAWFARSTGSPMPYRLYALSNVGSLGALLLFPVAIERWIGTSAQLRSWSGGFAVFAILCAWVAFRSKGGEVEQVAPVRIGGKEIAWWFTLAAVPSALLMAVTNHLSQNVAAMPFLWILPLAAYLLTLIVCFDRPQWYGRQTGMIAQAAGLGILAWGLLGVPLDAALEKQIPLFIAGLLLTCYHCHGELVARRPAPGGLTVFYLTVAAGGAAGGLLIGVAAPRVLSGPFDLPVTMTLAAAITLTMVYGRRWITDAVWAGAAVGMVLTARIWIHTFTEGRRVMERTFYGFVSTKDADGVRIESSGIINHGVQFLDPARRLITTTYYGPDSGAALAIRRSGDAPVRVGMIGLGVGTLAAYGRAGDAFTFYEINPSVIRLAREEFTFLADSRAAIEVREGDARLTLEREAPRGFDVLVVDAFNGDAIPVHLLTREAFAIYLRHLKPGGTIAVHASNLFLDLPPIVHRIAADLGLPSERVTTAADPETQRSQSEWVLVGGEGAPSGKQSSVPLWTDDFCNPWDALK